jgi:hypothetical protein
METGVADDAAVALRYPTLRLVLRRDKRRDVVGEVKRVTVGLMDLNQQVESTFPQSLRLRALWHASLAGAAFRPPTAPRTWRSGSGTGARGGPGAARVAI